MVLSKKDIELIMQLVNKDANAKIVDLVNTAPEIPVSEIPTILKGMTPTELKKQFGLDTFKYKFIGIKSFMQEHNITSGSKYAPTLNYENKHLVNELILKGMNSKQKTIARNLAIKTLKDKLNNMPKTLYGKKPSEKQLGHIKHAIETELKRWE